MKHPLPQATPEATTALAALTKPRGTVSAALRAPSPTRASPRRKRDQTSAHIPSRSDGKTKKKKSAKSSKKKQAVTKPLTNFAFSSTKRVQYPVGTKLLLSDKIYEKNKVPAEVRGHLFVYEIVSFEADGKNVKLLYKEQVVKDGGNWFRVYKEGDGTAQVC